MICTDATLPTALAAAAPASTAAHSRTPVRPGGESAGERRNNADDDIGAGILSSQPDRSVFLHVLAAKPRRVRKARAAAAQPADQNAGLAQPGYAFTALQPAKTRRSANP